MTPRTKDGSGEANDTKARILQVAGELFRRYGYNGTGIKQIVEAANAPFSSLYHFFPGGKRQLTSEVLQRNGKMYEELVLAVLRGGADPVAGTRDVFEGAAAVLEATDYIDACPIETVALEVASTDEELRAASHAVFESWLASGAEYYAEGGVDRGRARMVTMAVVELLEGAFVLARAARDTEALMAAGEAAASLVAAELATARRRGVPGGRQARQARQARQV